MDVVSLSIGPGGSTGLVGAGSGVYGGLPRGVCTGSAGIPLLSISTGMGGGGASGKV